MKRIGFTEENFQSVILRLKTQTRRLGEPKYKAGDLLALLEPTQVLGIFDDDPTKLAAYVYYPWTEERNFLSIGGASYQKLVSRQNWRRLAQPRFMLDDFARYQIQIAGVKVHRLQDVSRDDAIAEGVECDPDVLTQGTPYEKYNWIYAQAWRDYLNGGYDLNPVQSYASMWAKIHGDNPNTGWNANPWVTAYTFEVKP